MDLFGSEARPGDKRKREANVAMFIYPERKGRSSAISITGRSVNDIKDEMGEHCKNLWGLWMGYELPNQTDSQDDSRDFMFALVLERMQSLFLATAERPRGPMMETLLQSDLYKCGTFCTYWDETISNAVKEDKAILANRYGIEAWRELPAKTRGQALSLFLDENTGIHYAWMVSRTCGAVSMIVVPKNITLNHKSRHDTSSTA